MGIGQAIAFRLSEAGAAVMIADIDMETASQTENQINSKGGEAKAIHADVRSIAEYVFVGHPRMAYNIPLRFWNEELQDFESNETFIEDVKSRFKKDNRLIFLCRSGGRSLRAAKMARNAGFTSVFNVSLGFIDFS